MTQLVLKSPIDQKELDSVLSFLKSRNIDAEILQEINSPVTRRFKIKYNESHILTDEQLEEKLSKNESDFIDCTDIDYKEIIDSHHPILADGLEKWL
jgi:hypothetical protein